MEKANLLVDSVTDDVVRWRRHFHMYPELSFREYKTAQYVHDALQTFGELELSRPTKTSVVARLVGKHPGPVLALRADMDALPIQEENQLEFASRHPGIMHACGHDAHTAMLLGAAKVLAQMKDELEGEIRFLFQHAEEQHPGGAQEMVRAEVVEGVDEVIALHLNSLMPVGKIEVVEGPVTANSDRFDIHVYGKGGHASQPQFTVDPIVIGSQIVTNLQNVVSRRCDPFAQLVVSVTQFHGGSAYNIIPDSVIIKGSVRSLTEEVRSEAEQLIEQIAQGVTRAHDATFSFEFHRGYSSVVNDSVVTQKVRETVRRVFGETVLFNMPPMMGGEDFSAFSARVPACFIWIGAGNEEKGIIYPHHHPRFAIDESALKIGVKLFVFTALGYR